MRPLVIALDGPSGAGKGTVARAAAVALGSRNIDSGELYRAVGREVPEALRLYESLGRFRDALLAHEWRTESDVTHRARLERVMRIFSACETDLGEPQITAAKLTTAP